MATVEASKTIIVMGRETTYGAAFKTPTVKLPDMMEYSFGVSQITVPQKTQTLEPKIKTSQAGRKLPTVTLSGILTYEGHEELLVAAFGDTTSPYVWATSDVAAGAAGHSYTILQAIPSASDDLGTGVEATGCRLETLEISKQGEYIGYTATFRAKAIDDQVDFSAASYLLTGITNTTYPELTPFLWQDVDFSLMDDSVTEGNVTNFSLTLTNEFIDDDVAFAASQTKMRDYICGVSGTLTAEFLYDTVKDATIYDNLVDQTTYADQITLYESGDATDFWTISTEGQYIDYSKPDKEKCLYLSSYTKQLMGDSSNTAISIAVT